MNQCKRKGCWSYALNDHKESGFCDKCYWIEQAEQLTAENARLRAALEKINGFTMSKFASHADMSRACLTVSGEALKGQP